MTGDMAALGNLIARVQVGTRVSVYSSGANEGTRTGSVTTLSDNLYGSGKAGLIHSLDKVIRNQGRAFGSGWYDWPVKGEDFEVIGNTVREYGHSVYAGGRVMLVEVTFTFPSA